ncbi:hypothetical protein HT031_002393 [Scenedesmus sp. PABB004]|nr:hypothetical protein HT031_002393 [Scenedesmus sp. PABB004]
MLALARRCGPGSPRTRDSRSSRGAAPRTAARAAPPAAAAAAAPGAGALTRNEQRSLAAAAEALGLPGGGAAAAARALAADPAATRALHDLLESGVSREARDLAVLEGAVLLAEALAAAGGALPGAAAPQDVEVWQPIFASSGGWPRLLYIPVPEYFDLSRALPDATAISVSFDGAELRASRTRAFPEGDIDVITHLGPLTTHFLGTAEWRSATELRYAVTSLRVDARRSGRALVTLPFRLRNSLNFFAATPRLACARSALGGTMLMAPAPPGAA